MSSSYTTNLHLEKPADGDASWGTAVRASLDFIDALLGTTILWGLVLSAAGSSSSFGVASGQAGGMALASAVTKTTGSWAVGTGNGSLDVGTVANSTWYYPYLIKRVDTGVVDVLTSLGPGYSATVTMTLATPGVVTLAAHGLQANAPVKFTTTGALPTGLTAGTQYYVKTVSTVDTFTVSATQGGAAIATSGSQSGVHTVSSTPVLPANYTLSRRLGAMKTDGSAHWLKFTQFGDLFIWASTISELSNSNIASATTQTLLGVPPGLNVRARFRCGLNDSAAQNNLRIASPSETSWQAGDWTSSVIAGGTPNDIASSAADVLTNTAAQVLVHMLTYNATNGVWLVTNGWIDDRGKLG